MVRVITLPGHINRLHWDATNNRLGIGTATPVGTLHVKGGQGSPSLSADTNNINVVNSSTAAQLVTGAYSTGPYAIWMQVKDSANTSTSYPLVLNPLGGNVGIGTTTPGSALSVNGRASANLFGSETNCSSSAGPAVCAAAAAGSVIIPAAGTDVTVNTTAVTANSQIFAIFDQSLGTKLGVTCNSTTANPHIGARVAGTSFTIHANVSPVTNPACFSYFIIN